MSKQKFISLGDPNKPPEVFAALPARPASCGAFLFSGPPEALRFAWTVVLLKNGVKARHGSLFLRPGNGSYWIPGYVIHRKGSGGG